MSKPSYLFFAPILLILQIFTQANGQDVDFGITVDASKRHATVVGRFIPPFRPSNAKNFYFRESVKGHANLGERLSGVELFGKDGELISTKRLISGEYLADAEYDSWKYVVDLLPSNDRTAAAHSSWIGSESGILMLDDLLPQFGLSGKKVFAKFRLEIPAEWNAYSSALPQEKGVFTISDIERSVVFIGKNIRRNIAKTKTSSIGLSISGQWLFTDQEAQAMASEIYDEYVRMFGEPPDSRSQIGVFKFPYDENPGNWEAETRGSTVTIISSDMMFRSQSLQRLHEQLRHEIFHLWFPNSVELMGDYAWFYEGFALYQSLKTAVLLNRIRFEDFLDTLSRTHTIDSLQRPHISLIDGTKTSNKKNETEVYARGMLVAFLADVAMLKVSKGRQNISVALRNIFERHKTPAVAMDANEVVIKSLGLPEITERYIRGSEKIEWDDVLMAIGIDSQTKGSSTVLSVASKLNGGQKAILNKLGYNSWRKSGLKR